MTNSFRLFLPASLLLLAAVASQSAVAADSMPAGTYRKVTLPGPARIHISAIKNGSINVYDVNNTLRGNLANPNDFIRLSKGTYYLGLVRGGIGGINGYEFDMDISQSSATVNYSFHAVSKLGGDGIAITNVAASTGVNGKIDPKSTFEVDSKGTGSGTGSFLLVSFE